LSAITTSTCIVGIADEKGVYLGGDSAGSNVRFQTTIRDDVKVFRNGPMILGGTTSFRMLQLLQYTLKIPKQKSNQTDHEFMVSTFIEAVRKCFEKGGFGSMSKGGSREGGEFLVGYNGKLYSIYGDFQVGINADGYAACGCGDDLALGSLFTTKDLDMTPRKRLTAALEAASHHSAGVSGPYVFEDVLNTPAKKKTIKKATKKSSKK